GGAITIDRGAVLESYVIGPAQIEQTFRFEKSPGPGDLVVRLAVETELQVRAGSDGGLELANDRGGVRYGRPEVVDSQGRRAAMESAWRDGGIELSVPGAFLEEAAFPVTIDPVLVSFPFMEGGPFLQDLRPDVAYDVASDLWAVVYEEVYSTT